MNSANIQLLITSVDLMKIAVQTNDNEVYNRTRLLVLSMLPELPKVPEKAATAEEPKEAPEVEQG